MQTETPTPYPDDEIDLRQLVATLWDGRWWIIATTVLGSAVAVAYALLATPIFREALVQIRQESRAGGGINALAAQFGFPGHCHRCFSTVHLGDRMAHRIGSLV